MKAHIYFCFIPQYNLLLDIFPPRFTFFESLCLRADDGGQLRALSTFYILVFKMEMDQLNKLMEPWIEEELAKRDQELRRLNYVLQNQCLSLTSIYVSTRSLHMQHNWFFLIIIKNPFLMTNYRKKMWDWKRS